MAELFASDLDTERLIMGLELYVGHKIDPDNSLLIFDEVQEVLKCTPKVRRYDIINHIAKQGVHFSFLI